MADELQIWALDDAGEVTAVETTGIPFQFEPPPNAPMTERAPEQWYCLLDAGEWAEHKDALIRLVASVDEAWIERLNRAR